MTITQERIAELRGLEAAATQGEWQLQDGCSWRRIGTREHDGNVLCPTNHHVDWHPDLTCGAGEDLYANLKLIVSLRNAAPALLDAAEQSLRLEEEVARLREALRPFARAAEAVDSVDPGFPDDGAALRASFDYWTKNLSEPSNVRMRDLRLAALSPPAADAGVKEARDERLRDPAEIPAAIELWFFRDLGETQRRQLFNWCGFPGVEANGEVLQRDLLRSVLAALSQIEGMLDERSATP